MDRNINCTSNFKLSASRPRATGPIKLKKQPKKSNNMKTSIHSETQVSGTSRCGSYSRFNRKENAGINMKDIMMERHSAVYHKSGFTDSSSLSFTDDIVQVEANQTMCRICLSLEDSVENQQVTPCACSGSLQYVHIKCLKQWRQTKRAKGFDISCCDLCQQPYNVKLLGSSDVPVDKLLKMEEDLKQLVKSGIYLMLVVRSWKADSSKVDQSITSTLESNTIVRSVSSLRSVSSPDLA